MEPGVLYESHYTYDVPFDSFVKATPFLTVLIFLSLVKVFIPGILFLIFFGWLVYKSIADAVKEHDHTMIQITHQDIRIVKINGPVVRAFPFQDLMEVYASDNRTLHVKMRSFTNTCGYSASKLTGVGQAMRFAAIAQAQAQAVRQEAAQQQQQSAAPQIPAHAFQPAQRTVSESAADSLHAAEQLLMTGQITQGQYDVMTGRTAPQQMQPSVPQQNSGALDLQNAEEFLRRNEMIAQQMRAEQAVNDNQQEEQPHGTGRVV